MRSKDKTTGSMYRRVDTNIHEPSDFTLCVRNILICEPINAEKQNNIMIRPRGKHTGRGRYHWISSKDLDVGDITSKEGAIRRPAE